MNEINYTTNQILHLEDKNFLSDKDNIILNSLYRKLDYLKGK